MSLQPITAYRNSPPVSGVGDKQLERTRREFLDLIKSDERRHDGGANRDQKSGDQQHNAQETARQERLAADRRAKEPSFLPASARATSTARPMHDGQLRDTAMRGAPNAPIQHRQPEGRHAPAAAEPRLPASATVLQSAQQVPQQAPLPAAAIGRPVQSPALALAPSPVAPSPAQPRQPGPIGAPPPVDARPQLPQSPAGSQLVAPAAIPGAQDAGQALPGFRLSSQVPREVAERIAQFMRTGTLNRDPFSFAPLNHVHEAEPVLTPEQEADLAVASLIAESAPHMRLPDSMLMEGGAGEGGFFASPQPGSPAVDAATANRTQAAIRAQAALQPPTLVPTEPLTQPTQSSVSRGAANPLFGPSGGVDAFGEGDEPLVDLIAGPREFWPRSRIA
ncbi:MAG TPA: hypothetical protein VLQ65_08190 [Saliniramus sp.]|nr:hypothetical protein [Saliniramus sp.]